jgi:hypothetical protein
MNDVPEKREPLIGNLPLAFFENPSTAREGNTGAALAGKSVHTGIVREAGGIFLALDGCSLAFKLG